MVDHEAIEFNEEGYACFRPAGPATVDVFLKMLKEVLGLCQERGVTRLLVDLTRLTHRPLTTLDRFNFGSSIASFWDRGIRLGIIGREDQLDRERFGALVAQNRGLYTMAFETEEEALNWLRSGGKRR